MFEVDISEIQAAFDDVFDLRSSHRVSWLRRLHA